MYAYSALRTTAEVHEADPSTPAPRRVEVVSHLQRIKALVKRPGSSKTVRGLPVMKKDCREQSAFLGACLRLSGLQWPAASLTQELVACIHLTRMSSGALPGRLESLWQLMYDTSQNLFLRKACTESVGSLPAGCYRQAKSLRSILTELTQRVAAPRHA